tara:strand:+ start:73018 stop:73206 length:189 start_codon:yes stop_codon:yes gene_type:complete
MEKFSAELLSIVFSTVFYAITLIPAFVVGTYIVGREKEKRFSAKQIIAFAIALIPFLFFAMN